MILITSCDKIDKQSGKFIRMDIEDAKTLFIASSESGSKMYGVKKTSSKSTSEMDGEIYEISYLDGNGEQIEKNNPTHIFDAGDFVIVIFVDWILGWEAYFVRKSDGLVYAIPEDYMPLVPDYISPSWQDRLFGFVGNIQLDKNKNIYYTDHFKHPTTLYKVSSIASSKIQFSGVSAVNDNVRGFCVDDEGQIVYAHSTVYSTDYLMRYRKVDGSFVDMTIYNYDTDDCIESIWKGTDGLMYGFIHNGRDNPNVCLIKIQDGQITKIRDAYLFVSQGEFSARNTFRVQGRIIYSIPSNIYPWYIIDISNESLYQEIRTTVQPNMVVNDQLCYFDDKAFSCTLVDIDTGETSLLYDLDESRLGNYDIDKIMSVTDSGVVFSAVRLSDGNYVVAKIGLDNSVTIQQTIEGNVTVVMPLNI